MIAYEIQLWYVIRDKIREKIQSETKNPARDKIWEKNFCQKKQFGRKKCKNKIVSDIVSDFQYTNWAVLDKSMLIITKWYNRNTYWIRSLVQFDQTI